MSQGRFVKTFYQAQYDTAEIFRCLVQQSTLDADIGGTTNDAPTGPATQPIQATISTNKKRRGVRMRGVAIQLPDTGQPLDYAPGGIIIIPCLTPAFFLLAATNSTIDYLGSTCRISYVLPEQVN